MLGNFGQAFKIVLKTLPFILLRFGVYVLFGIGFCVYWVLVFFMAHAGAKLHPGVGVAVFAIGLILSFPFIRLIREYFLYVIKIGHVAVITQLVIHGELPEGVNQVEWGKDQVMRRFKETSVLFVVDRLVNGVIRSINGMMQGVASVFQGVPGLGSLVGLAKTILRFSLTYVDESVMARNFMVENETVWQSAKTGAILYAQSWKEILKTAVVLGLAAVTSYAILAILFLIPFWGFGAAAFPKFRFVFIIFAFIFAGVVKLALFDPWALTSMILVYLKTTRDMVPDRAWEDKLSSVSKKFRELQAKAIPSAPPPQAPASPPS